MVNSKTSGLGTTGKGVNKAREQKESAQDDACRCKETSEMTPGELFKLMIDDLAFWKKGKKE